MTVGGVIGINGPSLSRGSSTPYRSIGTGTGRGTGNPVTREDLRKYAEEQKAKKEAKRKSAISSRATEIRVESARAVQARKSKLRRNKKRPHANLLSNAGITISNTLFGPLEVPTREQAVKRATMEVDKKIAAQEAADTDEIRKGFELHGIGGGRKTKKHRNKKNNTKRRR